jgi:hypothetical protein
MNVDGGLLGGPLSLPQSSSTYEAVVAAPYGAFVLLTGGLDGGWLASGTGVTFDGGLTNAQPWPLLPLGTANPYDGEIGGPVLAAFDGGALLAGTHYAALYDAYRVSVQTLSLNGPLGEPCQYGAQCASGICDLGVCCVAPGACTPDAGPDGGGDGETDAGTRQSIDAGRLNSDAGTGLVDLQVGCGCRQTPGATLAAMAALALLARAAVRRKPGAIRRSTLANSGAKAAAALIDGARTTV